MKPIAFIRDIVARILERTGSSMKKEVLNKDLPIAVERVSGATTRIKAKVVRDKDGFTVSGTIARVPRFVIPQGSHLHVVAIDSCGKRLIDQLVRCDLSQLCSNKFGSRRDSVWYRTEIHPKSSDVIKIKIVFHNHSHASCLAGTCQKTCATT